MLLWRRLKVRNTCWGGAPLWQQVWGWFPEQGSTPGDISLIPFPFWLHHQGVISASVFSGSGDCVLGMVLEDCLELWQLQIPSVLYRYPILGPIYFCLVLVMGTIVFTEQVWSIQGSPAHRRVAASILHPLKPGPGTFQLPCGPHSGQHAASRDLPFLSLAHRQGSEPHGVITAVWPDLLGDC